MRNIYPLVTLKDIFFYIDSKTANTKIYLAFFSSGTEQ